MFGRKNIEFHLRFQKLNNSLKSFIKNEKVIHIIKIVRINPIQNHLFFQEKYDFEIGFKSSFFIFCSICSLSLLVIEL